jgi:transposase
MGVLTPHWRHITSSRDAGCRGFLHADAYSGFRELYRPNLLTGDTRLLEVACWAHARRKLYEVHVATKSPAAQELLERIGELFAIEAG